jgi:hypothetical protein
LDEKVTLTFQLEVVFMDKLSCGEYEAGILGFARGWFQRDVMLGRGSQFGHTSWNLAKDVWPPP